jgi:HD superfamily phosphohydrolase
VASEFKTINDTVHGTIRLDPLVIDLMETLELQRLNSIRQLGLTYLVFPGANHSRIEHCLGVGHVAGRMADALGLPPEDRALAIAAGLLHDVGHGPFSHTLEHVLSSELSVDHMDLTQRIITGEDDNVAKDERAAFPEVPRIPAVLEKHGIKAPRVAALIRGLGPDAAQGSLHDFSRRKRAERRVLYQIIHSAVDADQVDYLIRDAHYTGVALGVIDVNRLMQTLVLHDGEMAVDRKGLPALEGILVARGLMYSSVYFHKTVRIAETMVSRAVERATTPIASIQKMVDHELLEWLKGEGGFQAEVALRIKYRKLFKRAIAWGPEDLAEDQREALRALADDRAARREAEDALARKAGVDPGRVVVDIPLPELLVSEPRIASTDVPVVDEDGSAQRLSRLSPIARALQLRAVSDWVVMVACDPAARGRVAKAAPGILFGTRPRRED